MINRLDNISLSLGTDESELYNIAQRKAGEKPAYFKILKKSLDARRKNDIKWIYSIEFSSALPAPEKLETIRTDKRVVIIGSGPAGLFCGVRLAVRGFKPIIIERGGNAAARTAKIAEFTAHGQLDEECNVQFGEGGAGTFSDGKLNTQTHRGRVAQVLRMFTEFGAPAEIEYLSKPHIGSDNLPRVVGNMRDFIVSRGGEVRFDSKFIGLNKNYAVIENYGNNYTLPFDALVLAIGHSARDTFEYLHGECFAMEAREFAVGVRIEHLQSDINAAQYGEAAKLLPAADYKLVSHAGARSCFTFCMCPGGVVMPSSSEIGGIVTNGMSRYARDGANANSGLLVQIKKSDFGGSVLSGMEYQRTIERAAFELSGTYAAPVQTVGDFMKNRTSAGFGKVTPSYPSVYPADIRAVLPHYITDTLAAAIPDMAKRLRGFDTEGALLTAPETRFSSPVRILRSQSLESLSHPDVYPCGEGCGYSGGITSSAADGLAVADALFERFK